MSIDVSPTSWTRSGNQLPGRLKLLLLRLPIIIESFKYDCVVSLPFLYSLWITEVCELLPNVISFWFSKIFQPLFPRQQLLLIFLKLIFFISCNRQGWDLKNSIGKSFCPDILYILTDKATLTGKCKGVLIFIASSVHKKLERDRRKKGQILIVEAHVLRTKS